MGLDGAQAVSPRGCAVIDITLAAAGFWRVEWPCGEWVDHIITTPVQYLKRLAREHYKACTDCRAHGEFNNRKIHVER